MGLDGVANKVSQAVMLGLLLLVEQRAVAEGSSLARPGFERGGRMRRVARAQALRRSRLKRLRPARLTSRSKRLARGRKQL